MTPASAVLREKHASRSTAQVARGANATLFVFSFALLLAGGAPVVRGQSATLPPGLYTALLAGLNNGVGVIDRAR